LAQAEAGLVGAGEEAVGPEGQSLAAWRQQLRDALRPGTTAAAAVADMGEPTLFAGAFARGVPLAWSVPPGDEGPRLTWPDAGSAWPGRLAWTAVLGLLGAAGVWWSRRLGPAAWPEQLIILGMAAWAADGRAVWLAPAAAGAAARLALLGRTAWQRWRPELGAGQTSQ
jgi:hypothetical protein